MKCNVCGKIISEDVRFCKYCDVPVIANGTSNLENYILTDEDGNSVCFEFLDLIIHRGKEYVVLLQEDDNSDEVVVLQVESLSDNSERYVAVENLQILETILEIFKERNRDFFTFID